MSYLNTIRERQATLSPYIKAKNLEVGKPILLQMISARELTNDEKIKLNIIQPLAMEFTLFDVGANSNKTWTTGSNQVFSQLESEDINENDYFTLETTGKIGKGNLFWKIKKASPASVPEK
jgi:hypothetical protein